MPTPTLFRKKVLAPGTYHAPEGAVAVTPERIARWVGNFRKMKADGIRIPVPYGHQSKANPVEPTVQALQDERNFLRSRYNATYVEDLEVDPQTGGLVMTAPPPPGYKVDLATGSLVNERDGTQIAEVSAAICDWKDGKGNKWQDCIRHVALTPLPVAHGTGGFTMGTEPADSPCSNCFTLATGMYESNGGGNGGAAPATPTETKPVLSFNKGGDGTDHTAEIVSLLGECGIQLPEDTSAENFMERLLVGLKVAKSIQKPESQQPGGQDKPDKNGNGQGDNAPLTEETPPIMMSLDRLTDPLTLKLAKRMEADSQARRKKLIAGLAKRTNSNGLPYLNPRQVEAFELEASRATFSITADGEPAETELDRRLVLLDAVLKDHGRLATEELTEEVPPEGKAEARNEAIRKEAAERAQRVSRA